MALQEWLTPSAEIATAGLIVSVATLRMMMRVDRRQRTEDYPTVNLDLGMSREAAGWIEADITLRNRTDSSWTLEGVVFKWPQRVRAIEYRNTLVPDGGGGRIFSAALLSEATRDITLMATTVGAAGTPRSMFSSGDESHTRLLLSLERPRKRLSMHLILRSKDAKQRAVTIAVTRETPLEARMAID